MAKKTTKKGNSKPLPPQQVGTVQKKVTPTVQPSSKPSVATLKPYTSKLVFRSTESQRDPLLRKVFWGSSGLILAITLFLSLGSGINGDDFFQNHYSDKILSFYSSMGQDTSCFNVDRGVIKIYGGLFELSTAVINSSLGYEKTDWNYHHVRHLLNALFGVVAMIFTGLFARQLGGWRAGLLALWFIFLSPRFLGHSLMNPKDIPFATGYIVAMYYMLLMVKELPKPSWKTLLGLTLGIAVAFGIRAGGLILVAYLAMFVGLAFLLQHSISGIWKSPLVMLKYAGLGLIPIAGGLVLGTLTWPYGITDPIHHIPEALQGFTKFAVGIKMLFNGKMIFGNEAPPSYLPTWLFYTLSLNILIGVALLFTFAKSNLNRYTPFFLFMALFGFVFPVVFVIAQGSTLYDGWRHLLFSYPPLVALAALGWDAVINKLEKQKIGLIVVWSVLAATLIEPTIFIARNAHFPYVYFNPIAGGISGAFGKYETDYWGVSVKQGLDWMEQQGIIGPNMTDTVIVVSNFSDALDKYAVKRYKGKVRTGYVRFRERHNLHWDYGLFASRFVPGSYLKNGNWPPADLTIHTIKANNVPLLAIMKNENDVAYRGVQAAKVQDYTKAIELLTQETQQSPNNEVAYSELARCYMQLNQLPQVKEAAEKALAIEPENLQAVNLLGLYYLRVNDINAAEKLLLNSLEFEPKNSVAFYYLAIIEEGKNNLSKALDYAKKSIDFNNKFKEGYQLVAQLYEKMGDTQNAARYNQAVSQLGG